MGAQRQFLQCAKDPLIFRKKITSCMTFGVHEQFLDYLYELLQLLSALCSDVKKILYIFTSAFSALNYCSGMFFKSLSYLYEVVHTKFFADFWTFRNFDRNFAKIVAPSSSSNENRNFTAFLKGQSSSNKTVKIQSKSIHKQRHNTCSNYSARTNGPSNSERDKKKQTPYFRTYSRRAWSTIFPQTLHGDRMRRDH